MPFYFVRMPEMSPTQRHPYKKQEESSEVKAKVEVNIKVKAEVKAENSRRKPRFLKESRNLWGKSVQSRERIIPFRSS